MKLTNSSQISQKEKLHEMTFEEATESGKGKLKDNEIIRRVTIYRYPRILSMSVYKLKGKHKNLNTSGNVQCVTTAIGVSILQRNKKIKLIEKLKKKQTNINPLLAGAIYFQDKHYEWGPIIGSQYSSKTSISTLPWVSGAIEDIKTTLGVRRPVIAAIALMIGLSRSENWLPDSFRQPLIMEVKKFNKWIGTYHSELKASSSIYGGIWLC